MQSAVLIIATSNILESKIETSPYQMDLMFTLQSPVWSWISIFSGPGPVRSAPRPTGFGPWIPAPDLTIWTIYDMVYINAMSLS